MSLPFSADEVYQMAEQIERNGADFYRQAAKIAGSADARELLGSLAKMEDTHIELFSQLRKELPEKAAKPTVFDPYGEAALYLRAAADSHVFNVKKDIRQILSGHETTEEIIDLALRFEKDSIAFFLGMRDAVPEELGKDKIDTLIEQEKKHILDLQSFNKPKA